MKHLRIVLVLFTALGGLHLDAQNDHPCLACDREMRKTMEAIQAWRRLHHGQYPGRLVDLKTSGLLPSTGAICPNVEREDSGADPSHTEISSRGQSGDPPGTYEYELSDRVLKSGSGQFYMPDDAPTYTRQDLKVALLRRPFAEQVPILRCSSHRAVSPPPFSGKDDVRRNITYDGHIYWSQTYWEQLWLKDVPYCAREANVLFGLKGPPFFQTNRPPTFPEALDLSSWSCAFGDHAWWWTYPLFEEGANRRPAPHLRPFFEERHGRVREIAESRWWLNGLVQLQGRVLSNPANVYREPGMVAFVWERQGLRVGRHFRQASWLQGTVWMAPRGENAGWLVWHYEDGTEERVPIVYGKTTARFWGDQRQIERELDFAQPYWIHQEPSAPDVKEHWLRVYRQTWDNPRPQTLVTSVDFVSNRDSPAAPFLVTMNLLP